MMKRQEFTAISSLSSRLTGWQSLLLTALLAAFALPASAQLKAPSTQRATGIFMPQAGDSAAASPSQPRLGVTQPGTSAQRSQLVDEVVAIVNSSVITR